MMMIFPIHFGEGDFGPGAASTSALAAESRSQIRSIHAWCSGFIRTERRQVIRSGPDEAGGWSARANQADGSSTSARCKSRAAQASKIRCATSELFWRSAPRWNGGPDDDIELRRAGGQGGKAPIGAQMGVEGQGSLAALGEAAGKFAARNQRQELLRCPQRDGGCPGPGALQADLA